MTFVKLMTFVELMTFDFDLFDQVWVVSQVIHRGIKIPDVIKTITYLLENSIDLEALKITGNLIFF